MRMMATSAKRVSLKSLLLCAVMAVVFSMAASMHAAVPQRVAAIDDSRQTSVPTAHPLQRTRAAATAVELGAAPDSLAMEDMTIRFTMTAVQSAALDQLLIDQQNPNSPRFHQWLTPEQFAAQFGLAPGDLQRVAMWLGTHGFTVNEIARGGTFVRFSGTAGAVNAAFHADVRRYSVAGVTHFTNSSDPVLPSAIAAVTATVTGLHDFHPQPHHRERVLDSKAAHPAYTSSTSGNTFVAPGDFYTIYDENALFTSGVKGTGVTIAVVGQSDVNLSDINAFRSVSGLTANTPTVTLVGRDPGVPSANDQVESELDLEWSGATAPAATINFITATDVIDGSLTYAINNNVAPILSISYGDCEAAVGGSLLNSYNTLFRQANAQGQTIVAAAGDAGATDCDYNVTSATQGLAVDFPAALPSVTGVGGTMFNENGTNYFGTTNGTNGGSAISYIPEAVWNEDALGYGLSSGGGGSSLFFAKPAWQVGTGVPADSSRDVPDVSLNAAASHDPYLICTSGYCTNGYRNAGGYLDVVGGTSVGAPSFAGLLALVVQKTGSRIGNANPKLYALYNSPYASSVFHDITVGNNASPCTTGSTNCSGGGTIGYAAGAGYDRASGIGSVDAFNMVNDWALVTAIGTGGGQTVSTTTLAASSTSVTAGASITLTATVGSATATIPTGTVQFVVDGANVGAAVALVNGVATYSLSTAGLSSGGHTVQAAYSGDATFQASKSSLVINITAAASPDFTLSPATATVATKSGTASSGLTFTVTPQNGFTGNVTFTASTTSSGLNAGYTFSINPVVISSTTASGTTVFALQAYSQNVKSGLAQSAARPAGGSPHAMAAQAGGGIAVAGILLLLMPRRRRKLGALLAVAMTMGLVTMSGCGLGNGGNTGGPIGTTPGTYTINVSATATTTGGTTVTHSSVVTFVVQ